MPNKTLQVLALSLALLGGASFAQQAQPAQGQPGQLDPAQRARFAALQPVFDLSGRVSLLPELEKSPKTALSKAQARQLLPLLQQLQSAPAITAQGATKTLTQIEDKILTDAQVTALDDLDLRRQEERRAARAKNPNSAGGQGLRIPGLPGGGLGGQGGGQNRQGQNGQQAGQGGGAFGSGPFNPFTRGRNADTLKAYIAVLQKK
jgi:hypothetical protein